MKAAADIRNRLAATASDDFPTRAVDLLAEMGYRSGRRLPGQSGDVADFLAQFPAENPGTQSEQAFRQNATSAHLLFQLTDAEIAAAASAQGTLFDAESFAESNLRIFCSWPWNSETTGILAAGTLRSRAKSTSA